MSTIRRFLRDESGATAIEYGLIAALISVVIIATLTLLGDTLNQTFVTVEEGLSGAASAPKSWVGSLSTSTRVRPSGCFAVGVVIRPKTTPQTFSPAGRPATDRPRRRSGAAAGAGDESRSNASKRAPGAAVNNRTASYG